MMRKHVPLYGLLLDVLTAAVRDVCGVPEHRTVAGQSRMHCYAFAAASLFALHRDGKMRI
jgi:hypothetical protein